ncbi:hypothetical protein ACIRRA_18670 [Nocardia sp. NPDC101769]|uniref:hypothetical protein n=1 Tax=Nocardia sp. NPDC101769 TaxID=3364333 RepID=UPI003806C8B4
MTAGTYEYKSEFARRYFRRGKAEGEVEGEAKGEAKALLAVLRSRGITVDESIVASVGACTDIEQLDIWLDRAATAGSAEQVFGA